MQSKESSSTSRYLFLSFAAVAVMTGVACAIHLRWVTDDAFISFRYAQDLVRGLGLVYNSGERVEGYTNFLWTVMIALGMKLSANPVTLSMWLGIAFYAATLALLCYGSWRMQSGTGHPMLPIAAMAVALHYEMNVFATSGLETAMLTFLVTALYLLLAFERSDYAVVVAGVVSALLMMTRPDGIVFVAAAGVFLLIDAHRADVSKRAGFFLAPFILLYAPYWLWRFSYYGYVFPNTYYAKSAGMAYWSQGLEYLGLYLQSYSVLYFLPTLLVLTAIKYHAWIREWFGNTTGPTRLRDRPVRAIVLGILFVGLQMLYVVRVGGDFMFARFFICVTPIAYFTMESVIAMTMAGVPALLIAAAILAGTYLRHDVFNGQPANGYIANEHAFYPLSSLKSVQEFGEELHRTFEGLPVRVAFGGSLARTIYYMDPPYAIEAMTGLTDTALAHRSITERGRPGHEKEAPLEYLLQRRVQFEFHNETAYDPNDYRSLMMFGVPVRMLYYDSAVMTPLQMNPQIRFVDFPRYLDAYIAGMDTLPRERVARDFEGFRRFYFEEIEDMGREEKFTSSLNSKSQFPNPK